MNKNEKADIIAKICNGILLRGKQVLAPELSSAEWDELLEFASNQGVLPVIIQHLNNAIPTGVTSMGKEQLLQWIGISLQNEQNYKQRLSVMRKLARIFGKEGIDIMFLKGASLAQMYPNPEWRVFSDVDYYLFGASERGIELLAQKGIENSEYYHHHTQASMDDVLIENHYDFVERVNHKCDLILDDALKELAAKEGHAVKATFLGEDVNNAYLMTPTMNAIFLMRHMSAHFVSETIPLKMLYDWALFLKHHAKDVDWNKVSALYDQSGMTAFAGIIQELLRKRLDVSFSDCPVFPVKEEYVERVWESVIDPPEPDPHAKFTLRYYLFEAKTFFANRWKHKLVYPGESYILLFFKYAWLGVKKMLGVLK